MYLDRKVAERKGSPQQLWKTLYAVLCKGQQKSNPPTEGLAADGFLQACGGMKVDSVRASTASAMPPVFAGDDCTTTFEQFAEIDTSYVERLVHQAPNKNCALDPAPIWLVKHFAKERSPFIAVLFNGSMRCAAVLRFQLVRKRQS
jgi:hypothetical protein